MALPDSYPCLVSPLLVMQSLGTAETTPWRCQANPPRAVNGLFLHCLSQPKSQTSDWRVWYYGLDAEMDGLMSAQPFPVVWEA